MRSISLANSKTFRRLVAGLALIAGTCFAASEPTRLTAPHSVAVDGEGNLLVTCRGGRNSVVVLARDGKQIREFGTDCLSDPGGVTVDGTGRIIVANTGKGEVAVFDSQGKLLVSAGDMGRPEYVSLDDKGRFFVSDTGSSRILVYDAALENLLFVIDKVPTDHSTTSPLNRPGGTVIHRGKLLICDAGNQRILSLPVPQKAGEVAEPQIITEMDMSPSDITVSKDGRFYVLDRNQIRGFDAEWKPFGTFMSQAVGFWYQPTSVAVGPDGSVFSVDASTRRVLGTTADLYDEKPTYTLARGKGETSDVTIEWKSLSPRPTLVRYGPTEDCPLEYKDEKPKTEHRVVLRDLPPLTRYHFQVGFPIEAIPATTQPRKELALEIQRQAFNMLSVGNFSGQTALATLPTQGNTDWVAAPTVVVVYKHVTFGPDKDGNKAPDRILDDEDVAMLKSELETYRLWAWRHSSLKMNFDFTYVVVEGPRPNTCMGGVSPLMMEDILASFKEQGKDLHDQWYVLVCGVAGWYAHYLAGTVAGTEYELGSCYTGFGPGTKPGWWWFPTHEHGHLVHSWLMCSGASFFGFPDAPWTLSGQFGENFSFLAYNYRQLPVRDWLILKKGVLSESTDANGNGVPDDDPRVPLDEKRFGWDADMGGDCFARIMAGGRTPGYPGGTDTDFDGKVHKLNEGELYWIDRETPQGKITLDGKLADGEWREFYSIPNLVTHKSQRGLKAKLFLAWDKDNYYFALKSDKRIAAGFDLDGGNDGWFHGRDNLRFSIRPAMGGRELEAGGQIWDFLNNRINLHNGQHWYREAYQPGDIRAATGEQDGWHIIECAVPARPDIGIAPGQGNQFALRPYVWNDLPEEAIPQIGFFDGEDFIYNLECN